MALPLNINSTTFKHWDRMLLKFIWVNKKPRVKMKTLKQTKRLGGLALPDLQNYYKAAHIQTVQTWLTEEKTKWKLIELAPCRGKEKILPFLDSKLQLKIDNKSFQNTFRVWNKVRRDLNVHKEILL